MKKIITITTALLSFTMIGYAQNVEFKSGNFKENKDEFKAVETGLKEAEDLFEAGQLAIFDVKSPGLNFEKALEKYERAQKLNPSNALNNFHIGVCHAYSSSPYKSIPFFKKAAELDPECDPFLSYYLGQAYQWEGDFTKAIKSYTKFTADYKKADNFSKFVTQRKKECKTAKLKIANPERAWVDNISSLNTEFDEIAPSVSTDGSEIIFSSDRPNGHSTDEVGNYDLDIYSATYSSGGWSKAQGIKGDINTSADEVSNNLYYDGTMMLLHRDNDGQTDIYESKLKGLKWSNPIIMPYQISSTRANEKYASYNHNGYRIYFARDNETRSNGTEVMYSEMRSKLNKDYTSAAMVSPVNSKFNDGPVYMHPDGETMYVCSEGNGSLGGYDIFVSRKVQGVWTKPENLGYPINTPYDDFFFAATANGKFAYISSNRDGGAGGFDLYKVTFWGPPKAPAVDMEDFLLASVAMPMKDPQIEASVKVNKKSLTVFKGITIDAISRKAVEAQIEITDNSSGKIIETFTTNSATGKFLLSLNSGKNYGIAVKADGYLFHSENFDIPDGSAYNMVNKTIELKNIAVGSKIALRNIFFDVGKATLRSESNAELDRLVKLMKDVPALKIEISGHTDNTGSASLNEKLSQNRASAVVTYLKGKGIAAGRMTAKGYGSSMPIASNSTSDGRQENRRTEFEIKAN